MKKIKEILNIIQFHLDYWFLERELRNLTVTEELILLQPESEQRNRRLAMLYRRFAAYYAQQTISGKGDHSVWENIYIRMANAQLKKIPGAIPSYDN